MVEVAHEISPRIDFSLDYLQREWSEVPNVAKEFASWDWIAQVDFEQEWAIRESHLQRLQVWAAEGRLSETQRARYEDLLVLISRIRPELERMFAE